LNLHVQQLINTLLKVTCLGEQNMKTNILKHLFWSN